MDNDKCHPCFIGRNHQMIVSVDDEEDNDDNDDNDDDTNGSINGKVCLHFFS
jgi:hypothetical protein